MFALDDETIAVVDGAADTGQGRRRLTVWIGGADELVPHVLDGPPLIWTSSYADGDAVIVTGVECPSFVAADFEEPPSYEDRCGAQRGRSVAYRFTPSNGAWRLLNNHMPAGADGFFKVGGTGRWGLITTFVGGVSRPYRLNSRTGATRRLSGPTAGQSCTTRDGLIIAADIGDRVKVFQNGRYRIVEAPPPVPVAGDRVYGCLPHVGAFFRTEDSQTLEVITTDGNGDPIWQTIPAPPAGYPMSGGSVLASWAGVEGDRVKAVVYDDGEWRILGVVKGVVHYEAALVDGRFVYRYDTGNATALGVL
jgi:hypothetical protein